jgi:phage terminase large subunit-like protein
VTRQAVVQFAVPCWQREVQRAPWNEDPFHVLEGFSDLAHDDVDACSGALEMLNPPMKGLEHLRALPPGSRSKPSQNFGETLSLMAR